MKRYKVTWEIDVYANSPREAAQAARDIQLRFDSMAVVYDVSPEHGETVRIDLLEED